MVQSRSGVRLTRKRRRRARCVPPGCWPAKSRGYGRCRVAGRTRKRRAHGEFWRRGTCIGESPAGQNSERWENDDAEIECGQAGSKVARSQRTLN